MTYCDSSFLASLYVPTDAFNPQARKEAAKFTAQFLILCWANSNC